MIIWSFGSFIIFFYWVQGVALFATKLAPLFLAEPLPLSVAAVRRWPSAVRRPRWAGTIFRIA